MHRSTVGDTRVDVAIPMFFATFVLPLDQQSQAQTRQHGTCMFGDTLVAIGGVTSCRSGVRMLVLFWGLQVQQGRMQRFSHVQCIVRCYDHCVIV